MKSCTKPPGWEECTFAIPIPNDVGIEIECWFEYPCWLEEEDDDIRTFQT